ncbi:Cytochrome P450 3A9, partial [Termitomyces sp. T112]
MIRCRLILPHCMIIIIKEDDNTSFFGIFTWRVRPTQLPTMSHKRTQIRVIAPMQGTQFFAFLALVWALKRFTSKRDIDNIPGPEPESFFKGNLAQMFNASSIGWEFNSMLSERYGRVVRIWGMFGSKYLEIHDPKALHHILVKDQVVYEETSSFFASNTIMFGQGLLSTQGEQHKKQRKMLNPVFSIAHMRNM